MGKSVAGEVKMSEIEVGGKDRKRRQSGGMSQTLWGRT